MSVALGSILKSFGSLALTLVVFAIVNTTWKSKLSHKVLSWLSRHFVLSIIIVLSLLSSIIYSPYLIVMKAKYYRVYCERLANPMEDCSSVVTYFYAFKDAFFNPRISSLTVLESVTQGITPPLLCNEDDSLKIVYVIGESFNRHKSSLYGYCKNTNPLLASYSSRIDSVSADGCLLLFSDVVAPNCQTQDLVVELLSTHDIDEPDTSFENYPLFPSILKKAGFDVSYYDNQGLIGDARHFDFACTFFFSNETILANTVDRYNDQKFDYDGELIETYPPCMQSPKSLIIYHLLGQHVVFRARYPESFSYFRPEEYKDIQEYTEAQRTVVAEYDNATRYNDYVIDRIITELKDQNAVLIYVADHGEEVYDTRDRLGRYVSKFDYQSVKPVHEVPLVLWMSKSFVEKHSSEAKTLSSNRDKAIYNVDLVYTILDLAGVDVDCSKLEYSLAHDGGGRTDRKIYGKYDYDKCRKEIDAVHLRYEK